MRIHGLGKASALVAATAALALGLTACGSSGGSSNSSDSNSNSSATAGTKGTGQLSDCATSSNDCNSGKTKSGGSLSYVLEKTIPGWNLNTADDNVFELAEVYDAISPLVFNATPDLKPALNTDLMSSATQTKSSPQTIVYKVKPNAVWSDGSPIGYSDFLYQKDNSDGTTCPAAKCAPSSTAGYNDVASMTSSDNGKTITMVMKKPFSDWRSMFGNMLPAHIAAQHGGTKTGAQIAKSFAWFTANVPTWSGGPYTISKYQKDTAITLSPNSKWYGATKPALSSIVYRIITDQTQEPDALQNNDVQALYPQPNLSLVQNVGAQQGVSTYLGKGLNWEHFDFNEKNQFLKDVNLRRAMFTAIDRKSIIARTVGQYVPNVQPLNNRMYVQGQAGYQDSGVTASGQGSGDIAKAKSILQKAGYTGIGSTLKTSSGTPVTFRCTYSSGNADRQTSCELAQKTAAQLGIKMTLKTTTDLSELGTGDYDMIIFAWTGTPYPAAGAQQIWEVNGGSDFGHNVDPAAEKLINEGAQTTSATVEQQKLDAADKLLTNDAYSLPLFQKPTYTAIKDNLVNIRDNATSVGPPYNVAEWGEKAS